MIFSKQKAYQAVTFLLVLTTAFTLILEELVVGKMLPAMQGDNPHLHFMFECSERDNKASVTILWSDKTPGNPFDSLDELGKKILENAAEKIDFTTGEKNNSLRFIGL